MKKAKEAAEINTYIEVNKGEDQDALFINRIGMKQLLDRTFEKGVEFAQEWIGFEKELPPVMLEIIVKDSSGKKHKRVFKPLDNDDVKYLAETFTHWRPVEVK